jgi:hypothetical protein
MVQERMTQERTSRGIWNTQKWRNIWMRRNRRRRTGRRQWRTTRTNTIQKSRMTMDTREHKKKLRRRMEIRGKTKNTRVKKIRLKVSGNKGSKKPKDGRKGKENRKRREGRE